MNIGEFLYFNGKLLSRNILAIELFELIETLPLISLWATYTPNTFPNKNIYSSWLRSNQVSQYKKSKLYLKADVWPEHS